MKKLLLAIALSSVSVTGFAAKNCDELKSEIDAKIKANGVTAFTLDVVDASATADGKVVGTCEGGAKKIIYKKS
jgi:hypothetical protein